MRKGVDLTGLLRGDIKDWGSGDTSGVQGRSHGRGSGRQSPPVGSRGRTPVGVWGTKQHVPLSHRDRRPCSCGKVRGFYVMVMELGSRGVPRPLPQYGGPPPKKLEL